MHRIRGEQGTAILEAAATLPMVLLIAVGIFEFGRAYQTWQILTNAACEGARIAVLADATDSGVQSRVRDCMQGGQLANYGTAAVTVNRNATITVNGLAVSSSRVSVDYPFDFVVLQPVARLIKPDASVGSPLTMHAEVMMRNESQ